MTSNITVPLFAPKPGNINTSMSAAPKLALVPASRYYCDVNWSYHNACAKFRIERGLDGGPNFKLNKVPYFALKSVNINVSMSAPPKLALVPANH